MEPILTNYTLYQMTRAEEMVAIANLSSTIRQENTTLAYEEPFEPSWTWTIIDGLLMIFILWGNTLTILAVTLSRRLSNLISNKFVLNLAVSDLSVGLTLPYHLAFYLDENLGREKTTCVLRFILITLACCASIINLILIAVDRYVAILHPLHYGRYMSKLATGTLMAVGWMMAVGISLVPIFWNNWGMASSCDMHKVIPKEYTTNVLAPMFSMIWVVMLVLYWRIYREAALHTKRMRTTTCLASGPNDWKSIQVVLMVLGSFSICWMPYVVVICAQAVTSTSSNNPALYKAMFSLAMANSGVNPIIYAWKNTGFRKAFLRLLRCKSPDSPEFCRSFRNTTTHADRKLPLETISQKNQAHSQPTAGTEETTHGTSIQAKDTVTNDQTLVINNNSVKSDRCRIIENVGFEAGMSDSVSGCHIIENLGFEDALDSHNMKMIDSSSKDSDGDSVATLPMGHTDSYSGRIKIVNKQNYFV